MRNPPLFTFKHYAVVIRVLREFKPSRYTAEGEKNCNWTLSAEYLLWNDIVLHFAHTFAADNPKFKRDLFVTMCHQNEETK